VLGNPPQKKTNGRQVVGKRLPILSCRSTGRKAGSGGFSEWIIHRESFDIVVTVDPGRVLKRRNMIEGCDAPAALMIPRLERKLLKSCTSVTIRQCIAQEKVLV
jgi:hypothetical protein